MQPLTSFSNLFPEIVYDEDQIPEVTLDIWNSYRVSILPRKANFNAYIKHFVEQKDTNESLARTYYNNDRLWWLIPFCNNAEDPLYFLDEVRNTLGEYGNGTILILKPKYLGDILLNIKKIKNVENRKYKVN